MRTAAFVVGVLGGVVGFCTSLVMVTSTVAIAIFMSLFGAQISNRILPYMLAALGFYALGIVGGVRVFQRPGLAAILLACAAVGSASATSGLGSEVAAALALSSTQAPTHVVETSSPPVAPTRAPAPVAPAKTPEGVVGNISIPLIGSMLLLVASVIAAASWIISLRTKHPQVVG